MNKKNEKKIVISLLIVLLILLVLLRTSPNGKHLVGSAIEEPLEEVNCSEYQKIGDANKDQKITAEDSQLIFKIVLGEIPLPQNICCLDANKDQKITAEDSQIVFQIVLGEISEIGFCGIDNNSTCSEICKENNLEFVSCKQPQETCQENQETFSNVICKDEQSSFIGNCCCKSINTTCYDKQPIGDLNKDNQINLMDKEILKIVLKSETSNEICCFDINNDETLNNEDLIELNETLNNQENISLGYFNYCNFSIPPQLICNEGEKRETSCGKGICQNNGTETCLNNSWTNNTCIQLNNSINEVCNDNLDNDCDGEIDEGCSSSSDNSQTNTPSSNNVPTTSSDTTPSEIEAGTKEEKPIYEGNENGEVVGSKEVEIEEKNWIPFWIVLIILVILGIIAYFWYYKKHGGKKEKSIFIDEKTNTQDLT